MYLKIKKYNYVVTFILFLSIISCLKENELDLNKYDNILIEGEEITIPIGFYKTSIDSLIPLSTIPALSDTSLPIIIKKDISIKDLLPNNDKYEFKSLKIILSIKNEIPINLIGNIYLKRQDGTLIDSALSFTIDPALINRKNDNEIIQSIHLTRETKELFLKDLEGMISIDIYSDKNLKVKEMRGFMSISYGFTIEGKYNLKL